MPLSERRKCKNKKNTSKTIRTLGPGQAGFESLRILVVTQSQWHDLIQPIVLNFGGGGKYGRTLSGTIIS